MLDSVLQSKQGADYDWLHVQRALDRGITRFLRYWIWVMVWGAPLAVIGAAAWTLPAASTLCVVFFVGVGWLAWLVRAVFCRDGFAWRSSLVAWLGIGLGLAVFGALFIRPLSRIDLFFATGPAAWLAVVGFVLLLSQESRVFAGMRAKARKVMVALYFIAALYPFAQSLASREYSAIPAGLSITRYVQFGMGQYGLFGAGLGRG
ncbi:MAG: hypothetical protein U1C18_01950, partial [Patescibacteria group bacterium]|nr:hypothetical protein [Patescibacteria group bacterium]